jgi:hypothetical protein
LASRGVKTPNFRPLRTALKQQSNKKSSIGELAYLLSAKKKIGFAENKNRLCALWHSSELIYVIEYSREFESMFETASAYEPEGTQGIVCRKKPRVNNLVMLSLKYTLNLMKPKIKLASAFVLQNSTNIEKLNTIG